MNSHEPRTQGSRSLSAHHRCTVSPLRTDRTAQPVDRQPVRPPEAVDLEPLIGQIRRQIGDPSVHRRDPRRPHRARPHRVERHRPGHVPAEVVDDQRARRGALLILAEPAGALRRAVVEAAGIAAAGRPHRVEEVVVRPHHRHRALGRRVADHLVARVVEEVHALQVGDVAVAVGQHHLERHAVHGGAGEVHRRQRQHRVDAVRMRALPVDDHLPDGPLAASRVPHHADPGEVDRADEARPERPAARRRPLMPQVEVLLQQLAALAHAGVVDLVAEHVDAVAADGHDDEPVAGQALGDVVVARVVGDRLPACGARPAVGDAARRGNSSGGCRAGTARSGTARRRDRSDSGRRRRAPPCRVRPGRLIGLVAEVVDGAGDGVRPGRRRRRRRGGEARRKRPRARPPAHARCRT